MKKMTRRIVFAFAIVFALSFAVAQEQGSAAQKPADKVEAAGPQNPVGGGPVNQGVSEQLAHTSNEAAGEDEGHSELKHSSAVKAFARMTGLSVDAAYWVFVLVNFAIIFCAIGWAMKKNLPAMFRTRTETIRKGMDEARKASEEANRRLGDIESRLSRLDSEIAEMKKKADADAAAEEQRIRASAEEDGRKIVEAAEQEIEAAAKAARRDLKIYAAELAV
jgi:F-type H+-transporting ATPase subunit b